VEKSTGTIAGLGLRSRDLDISLSKHKSFEPIMINMRFKFKVGTCLSLYGCMSRVHDVVAFVLFGLQHIITLKLLWLEVMPSRKDQ